MEPSIRGDEYWASAVGCETRVARSSWPHLPVGASQNRCLPHPPTQPLWVLCSLSKVAAPWLLSVPSSSSVCHLHSSLPESHVTLIGLFIFGGQSASQLSLTLPISRANSVLQIHSPQDVFYVPPATPTNEPNSFSDPRMYLENLPSEIFPFFVRILIKLLNLHTSGRRNFMSGNLPKRNIDTLDQLKIELWEVNFNTAYSILEVRP